MDSKFYGNMYGGIPMPKPPELNKEDKRAVKVLGGMKVHGSHISTLEMGEKSLQFPSISYVKLLEEQIKELRNKYRELESKNIRNQNNIRKLNDLIRDLRRDLDRKVDLG